MSTLENVERNEEGFLTNPADWNPYTERLFACMRQDGEIRSWNSSLADQTIIDIGAVD